MSISSMARHSCTIKRIVKTTDSDGFAVETESTLAEDLPCYREGRHGSERWANLATFSNVTDLFRIRVVPDLDITTEDILYCGDECFRIYSIENLKGRGLYLEILATKVVGSVA